MLGVWNLILDTIKKLLGPVLVYILGWFGGLILTMCWGGPITECLNLIFDTTRFTSNMIPVACGIMGVIGNYFSSSQLVMLNKQ